MSSIKDKLINELDKFSYHFEQLYHRQPNENDLELFFQSLRLRKIDAEVHQTQQSIEGNNPKPHKKVILEFLEERKEKGATSREIEANHKAKGKKTTSSVSLYRMRARDKTVVKIGTIYYLKKYKPAGTIANRIKPAGRRLFIQGTNLQIETMRFLQEPGNETVFLENVEDRLAELGYRRSGAKTAIKRLEGFVEQEGNIISLTAKGKEYKVPPMTDYVNAKLNGQDN